MEVKRSGSRRTIALYILALTLALVVCTLLFADFRIASSRTNTNMSLGTSKAFSHGISPERIQAAVKRVYLHVGNRRGTNEVLAWQLRRALKDTGRFDVTLVNGTPGPDDHPLIIANANVASYQWLGLYGHCSATIEFACAADTSEITLDPGDTISHDVNLSTDEFKLRLRGSVTVDDTTWGLVTQPSYRRTICAEPADDIVAAFVKAIDDTVNDAREKQ